MKSPKSPIRTTEHVFCPCHSLGSSSARESRWSAAVQPPAPSSSLVIALLPCPGTGQAGLRLGGQEPGAPGESSKKARAGGASVTPFPAYGKREDLGVSPFGHEAQPGESRLRESFSELLVAMCSCYDAAFASVSWRNRYVKLSRSLMLMNTRQIFFC